VRLAHVIPIARGKLHQPGHVVGNVEFYLWHLFRQYSLTGEKRFGKIAGSGTAQE